MEKRERETTDERRKFTAFCAHHPYDRSDERTAKKFKRSTAKGIGNKEKRTKKGKISKKKLLSVRKQTCRLE